MLLRKLCSIIGKVKDWLGELKNHVDDAVYIFISLTFKWDIEDRAVGSYHLAFWQIFDALIAL